MPHDVFISYSHKDKPIADGICANLESAGFRCWIAPRDIAPGLDWPTAISNAISASRVMVLVFSANSNSSKDVSRELILAANNDLIIIPFKLDNIAPESGKQYYLARTHWLDAMNPPTQEQIDKLVGYVRSFLPERGNAGTAQSAPVVNPQSPEVKQPPSEPVKVEYRKLQKGAKSKNIWIWGILLLVAISMGSYFAIRSFGQTPMPTGTPIPTASSTLASTPTPSHTSTPRPTATKTPQPAWVTDFSQPILDAIANRSPSFQDDFHNKSGGWQAWDFCGKRMEYVDAELVITSCAVERADINYRDFVMELDGRFLPGTTTDVFWGIGFECAGCVVKLFDNGRVEIDVLGENKYDDSPPTRPNHVLIIAKGGRYAFYMDGEPFYYMEETPYRSSAIFLEAASTSNPYHSLSLPVFLAIDNFKIWNISDLP
jgi:hypothetical protein